jgi:lysophospholipase L1-like esterase
MIRPVKSPTTLSRLPTIVWLVQLILPTIGLCLGLNHLDDPDPINRIARGLMAFCLLWYGGCLLLMAIRKGQTWIATHTAQLLCLYISFAVSLAAAEAFCRTFVDTNLPPSFGPRCVQFSPYLGWVPIPGFEEIGAHGWRGPAIPCSKAPGHFRIVCVGDSTTFGFHCSWEDAWPHQLETVLNQDCEWTRKNGRTEVLNLGVPGYGPDQSMIALKKFGLAYSPDIVIFQLCLNDFADASYDHHWLKLGGSIQYKPSFVLEDGHLVRRRDLVPLPRDPSGRKFDPADRSKSAQSARLFESALWNLVRKRTQAVFTMGSRPRRVQFPQQHWPIQEALRANYAQARPLVWALITEMSRAAAESRAVFVLTLSPCGMHLVNGPEDSPPWRVGTFLREYEDDARAAGIPALNCMSEYFRAGGNDRFLLPQDPYHLNPQGNAFIAQTTAQWLKSGHPSALRKSSQ